MRLSKVSEAPGHAFIRLHKSHDVRRFRGHDGASERVVGLVTNSSVKRTFASRSFMFGQVEAWPAEADSVRESFEVREQGIWRYVEDRRKEFERSMIKPCHLEGSTMVCELALFRLALLVSGYRTKLNSLSVTSPEDKMHVPHIATASQNG